MLGIDFSEFAALFNRWAIDYVGIDAGELLARDGKSIRSSITNYESSQQDFTMLVSLFSQQRQQVVCALPMRNKQTGGEQTVRQMLRAIDLRGAVVSMDALHTKKHLRPSMPVTATT